MRECTCGNEVTDKFYRVFSVDGTLHACKECGGFAKNGNSFNPSR